ncbi:MAG TPA: sugar phosphate nucleotidyltransferase, partial [Candidatus Sumerlaeota bacterium]|nr:sugar phosphate nucleotidyltransferase [Candidatus Sumerlaeota bacterium]
RAKPAVPFGGIYRIIDFTLSNAMHSGVTQIGIVTQYRPYSLVDHVGLGEAWGFAGFGRKCKVLAPHTSEEYASFYEGTGDAIFRNIEFIERFSNVSEVLILSGDHIYRMDYRPMLELHRAKGAAVTIATQEVPWEETSRFGLMISDEQGIIRQFQEKPKSHPLSNRASLGIYIFNREALVEYLQRDQEDPDSNHDFGGDIIPRIIYAETACEYPFDGYWRDVGTIQSYYDTSMEALDPESGLELARWGVRTNHQQIPLAHQHPARLARGARVERSIISKGTVIEGEVIDSVLSPGVRVAAGARVHRSILLHNVQVGEGCHLDNVIVDKHGVLERDVRIGDPELGDQVNQHKPELLFTGTSVIGKNSRIGRGVRIGRNCLIFPQVVVEEAPGNTIESGRTIFFAEVGERV